MLLVATLLLSDNGGYRRYLPVKREIAIEAIVGTVQDRNVLVQRGMLDILISHFPLQNSVFSRAETIRLLHLILPVILRRETSVNRRFHAWLLSCKTQVRIGTSSLSCNASLSYYRWRRTTARTWR